MSKFYELRDYFYRMSPVDYTRRTNELVYSDISTHLPVLEYFAKQCKDAIEFGIREGGSTMALISGCHTISVDIETPRIKDRLEGMTLPHSWRFVLGDTGLPGLPLEPTDFLFIDTLHTYTHVKKELALYGSLAQRFIGFHDTSTCGDFDLSGPNPSAVGILPAIHEWLQNANSKWKTVYRTDFCNGLWILEKLSENP